MKHQAFSDYLAIDAVNWSTLREMRKSPLHYHHRVLNERPDTATLRAGRAAHTAVFEPDRFLHEYVMFKGKVRRGEKWELFKEQHATESIIKPIEYSRALAIRDAVRAHPLARPYLAAGHAERPIQWRDDGTGLQCKARLDFLSDGKPAIVDLKTTASVSYGRFASTAYKMGYHCQMGLYQWGVRVALDINLPVVIIAVESEPPHDVAVFEYGEPELEAGLNEARSLLIKLSYHREKNEWPGQYDQEQVLEFPAWATPDANDISELELEAS